MQKSSVTLFPKLNKQRAQQALEILETERILDRLRSNYFDQWLEPESDWDIIKIKLTMLNDLKGELRSIANQRD